MTGGPPPGMRVVLDARPLQDPERAPLTARYLDGLLGAFDAEALAGESFVLLLQSDLDDPTARFGNLPIVGRRLLPPTRLLRGAALAVDPFLLRGAALGAAWRADRGGAAGAVYHASAGAAPVFSRIPIIVTLLDLAPWELSASFNRGPAARFGHRLRTRLVQRAKAVIVGTEAIARTSGQLLGVRPKRLRVVPFAAAPAFVAAGRRPAADPTMRHERERLGLPDRYLVYAGRFDARHDLGTLLRAMALLAGRPRPPALGAEVPWPPSLLLAGASPDDRAAVARSAARLGAADQLVYAPGMPPDRLAALVACARAAVQPAVADAAGLPVIDALAAGVPVVASSVGALPELVGRAGILVEPRNSERLAEALLTAWTDDRIHGGLVAAARNAAMGARTWADVARETREIYAAVGARRGRTPTRPDGGAAT